MRRDPCALAILVVLGLAAPGWAQSASGLIGGFSPQTIVNQPIDTGNVVAPLPSFELPTQKTSFNLLNIFRQIRFPSFPALFGQSPLPPPSAFPTYPDFQPVPFESATPYEPRYVPTNNRYKRHRRHMGQIP